MENIITFASMTNAMKARELLQMKGIPYKGVFADGAD